VIYRVSREEEIGNKLTPAAIVQTQPIHLFLDLSLVERLLPVLRHISPAIKHAEATAPSSPIRPQRPAPLHRQSESYVLDDLTAQAAPRPSTSVKSDVAVLRCPMLRLSIRCPAPVNRRGTWGDGAHLRSGIVTLDLHGMSTKMTGPGGASETKRGKGAKSEGETTIEWQSMMLFFSRVPCECSHHCNYLCQANVSFEVVRIPRPRTALAGSRRRGPRRPSADSQIQDHAI